MEALLVQLVSVVFEKVLDRLLAAWEAKGVKDIGLRRGIRRAVIGQIASVLLICLALYIMVGIAMLPSVTGADAVAAAVAVGVAITAAVTYKRRREQWHRCRKLAGM